MGADKIMNINLLADLNNIVPSRTLNVAYVILDSIFLLVFLGLLLYKKRFLTVFFALMGGVLYFVVDYGIFHLALGSRTITFNGQESETITALVLLWMSLSYGITNFSFIWLCLRKDKYLKEWLLLIVGWWLVAPTLAKMSDFGPITTARTTGQYHYVMAIILVIGYLGLIVYNLATKKKMINLLWLNLIGISVQFGWEFSLLINGIRPLNDASFMTIIVNSLIETNLGMPYIYLIFLGLNKFITEDFKEPKIAEESDSRALSESTL